MNESYVKLYRKSLNSAVFGSEPLWHLWTYLLLSANWAERQLPDGTVLKPGQMVRGHRRIAEDLGWGVSKVARWLKRLEAPQFGNITITPRNGTLAQVITICNWETYQDAPEPSGTQAERKRNASGTQAERKEEGKKDKKGRSNSVRPTLDEVRAYCRERQNSIDPEQFFYHYEANGWVQGAGKKPIKSWKACVITWEKNNFQSGGSRGRQPRPPVGQTGRVHDRTYDNLPETRASDSEPSRGA